MNVLTLADQALDTATITSMLLDLRKNALVQSSHYAVAAIIEFQLPNNQIAYIAGVNVENDKHNRLSLHAEQNALASAQALLGHTLPLTRIWVMAAPDHITDPCDDPCANHHPQLCGHCRQILLAFATTNTRIYTITINGEVSPATTITDLLPKAFNENDLSHAKPVTAAVIQQIPLDEKHLVEYLRHIKPLIIDAEYKTSPIIACIIKVNVGGKPHYFAGALMQDIAFLTTDAVFAAVGQAITAEGANRIQLDEVFFYLDTLKPAPLSGSEISFITRFTKRDIPIHFYTQSDQYQLSKLSVCAQELYHHWNLF